MVDDVLRKLIFDNIDRWGPEKTVQIVICGIIGLAITSVLAINIIPNDSDKYLANEKGE